MNLILLRAVIRRERRPEYYHALDQAHAGDTDPFVMQVAEEAKRSLSRSKLLPLDDNPAV